MIFGFAILSIPHLYFRRFFSSHPFGIQHAGENTFRRQRQRPQSRASTTVDCIGDRRRNAVDTDLADALGAERAGRVVRLHDDRIKLWRRFDEGGDFVVHQGRVGDLGAVPHQLFEQCKTHTLDEGAFDLSLDHFRIDCAADVASRPGTVDPALAGGLVD